MTKEHYKKFVFVSGELNSLVKAIDPNIKYISYSEENGNETVNITYTNCYVRKVDITADSLLAIAKDVLKHL